MADRNSERRWLEQLTAIPTAPGVEGRVLEWVEAWVGRRPDLTRRRDRHGNLFIAQRGRKRAAPVVAVAHTDHPGFVVTGSDGRRADVEFRGGMRGEYFAGRPRLEFFGSDGTRHAATLVDFDPDASRGTVEVAAGGRLEAGDIGRWAHRQRLGIHGGRCHAPACDDLAGVAAALGALDRARNEPALRHFAVLLTRAEELGFVGAIGAARDGTLPAGARILSIECSRSFADSPLGAGPIVRVGDASSVFDHRLTNLVSSAAKESGIAHQRKLMDGGSCEATAFVAYGYPATGLCLPLANYHNMGNLDEVEAGGGPARPAPEAVSVDDYHGLVDLLLVAARTVDGDWDLSRRLDGLFDEGKGVL